MKYNKLVRDKIPDIIASSGLEAVTRILDTASCQQELENKLLEEVDEFRLSGEVEELADILEVVYAIAGTKGVGQDQLDAMRKQKREVRGGFDRRVFLIETKGREER